MCLFPDAVLDCLRHYLALIVGALEELVAGEFALPPLCGRGRLCGRAGVFDGKHLFPGRHFAAVGQRIISDLREDLFTHIESLAHEQLNEIPVGKLVTRVTNDTNAISMMFTNLLVTLAKNIFVILGILIAMLSLNYELTLMVLCFVPFIVIFTVIFRKFSRRAYRKGQGRDDGYQHLPVGESFRYQGHADFRPRG